MNATALFDELLLPTCAAFARCSSTARRRCRAESVRLDRVEVLQRLLGHELCRKLGIFDSRRASSSRS